MKPRSFSDLYREAERHQDYWVAGAILAFTESVVREMARQRGKEATPTDLHEVLIFCGTREDRRGASLTGGVSRRVLV